MPIRQAKIAIEINDLLYADLERTISQPRLKSYVLSAGHDRNRALALYMWNAAMGQAFHFPIQAVEVSLRNCINPILVQEFGQNWWSAPKFRSWITHERATDLDQARRRLIARNLPQVTDQYVATLSLGFWVGMIETRYNPGLWNKRIRDAFPNYPKSQRHDGIYAAAKLMLDFRNEIFHHDSIVNRSLSNDFSNMMTLLKWICLETEAWVRKHSSVLTVIRMKP